MLQNSSMETMEVFILYKNVQYRQWEQREQGWSQHVPSHVCCDEYACIAFFQPPSMHPYASHWLWQNLCAFLRSFWYRIGLRPGNQKVY